MKRRAESKHNPYFRPFVEIAEEAGCTVIACCSQIQSVCGIQFGPRRMHIDMLDIGSVPFSATFVEDDWRNAMNNFSEAVRRNPKIRVKPISVIPRQ